MRAALRERRPSTTTPVREGQIPTKHRVQAAGTRASEAGVDSTQPSQGQQMASRVTQLEAALKLVISSQSLEKDWY